KDWDATVEEIDAEGLLAAHGLSLGGWLGPPWLKDGWFHAYLLDARAPSDTAGRQAVDALYRRLVTGAYAGPTTRIELERQLVSRLTAGCERAVEPPPDGAGWVPNRLRIATVTRPPTSEVEIPSDALIPEPGTGLLREVGKGRSARARVTFRLVASAFHDSTRMTPADAV